MPQLRGPFMYDIKQSMKDEVTFLIKQDKYIDICIKVYKVQIKLEHLQTYYWTHF